MTEKEKIIKNLKKDHHVFKITKEVIYAIPKSSTSHYHDYNNFLKYAKEHPNMIFSNYYKALTEFKDIEEI